MSKTVDLEPLLDHLLALDATFSRQKRDHDEEAALETLRMAASLDYFLNRLVAEATIVRRRASDWRRYRKRQLAVLMAIDQAGIEPEGFQGLPLSDFDRLPDRHLASVVDFLDPDCWDFLENRLLQVGFLVASAHLPPWVVRYLELARRCYTLRMNDAAFVFLRGLVEAVSFAWLEQAGVVLASATVIATASKRVGECLRLVRRHANVDRHLMTKIHRVVVRGNALIHAKKEIAPPTDEETLGAIKDVIAYSERLFR